MTGKIPSSLHALPSHRAYCTAVGSWHGSNKGEGEARVAVVIPFYQRRAGLLRRAVQSALGQGVPVLVVVVDDDSPIDARKELAEMKGTNVVVLRQENAGPGAARNRGLQAIPLGVEYVAFLDSDDYWIPEHLSRAIAALDGGADFYFSDYVPVHSEQSTFSVCGFPSPLRETGGDDLFVYSDDLFDALLRRAPVGTSTVVYRRSIADQGFPLEFSYAEDVFYWMHLVRKARRIMFSTRLEAVYGIGVNIAASATWGSPTVLRKLHSEYRFHHAVASTFPLTAEQMRWSMDYRRGLVRSFRANLLHLAIRRVRIDWLQVWDLFSLEASRRITALVSAS